LSATLGVSFNHVSKTFGKRNILDDVSFEIEEGEALCILGRSGTGKSVTLKLMVGLLRPDSGTVCIGNDEISKLKGTDLSCVRRQIGFLFQSAALFDSLTLGENLSLPLVRFDKSKSPSEVKQAVLDGLKQVGLEKDANKLPSELSGGMRKRAGLARALILNPRLLLVDEPSSGLDKITAAEIDALLLRVKHERRTTMVIVSHDVHGARSIADKVAVLDMGRLAGFGTVSEVEKSENELVRTLITESRA
jgi:phospholipid/cholesterol/gamma-HCH transport system ATP-binding protein